ncbi:ABC transporter [Frankia canadensis]|uniref:ABC transporter n=1 Tax=Frankia canadensis TaxID=1836972 RepID=A0A2I2KPE3_9ACTN|nr:ABC transporter ATP-binding protein [Frankia canadensis]SNQ47526.1 ABC transporter [Frankia canadensis]SOU54816.1 ABC transporter [Frankia canadensis]
MARRTGSSPGGQRDAGDGGSRGRGRRTGGGATGSSGVAAARASQLTKVYGSGDTIVTALRGIDLGFPRGRFTAIMGPSGSGKSTLMHCLAGLDTVTRGRVFIGDVDLSRLSDKELTRLRRDRIGFIFQQFNLLPTLTAAENITLPLSIAGRAPDKEWMRTVVDAVGLAPRLGHRPPELSGGQQQRVACARALVTRPEIIFADEPTGNLDSRSGAEVLQFLRDSVTDLGQTIVMVTHDATAASYSDEVIFLADGRLVDAIERPTADEVLDRMKHLDAAQRGLVSPAADTGGYEAEDDYDDESDLDEESYGASRHRGGDRGGRYDDGYDRPDEDPADRNRRGPRQPGRDYPARDYPDQRYGDDGGGAGGYDRRYAEQLTGEFDAIPDGPPAGARGPGGGRAAAGRDGREGRLASAPGRGGGT